jgi:hypothetical protein
MIMMTEDFPCRGLMVMAFVAMCMGVPVIKTFDSMVEAAARQEVPPVWLPVEDQWHDVHRNNWVDHGTIMTGWWMISAQAHHSKVHGPGTKGGVCRILFRSLWKPPTVRTHKHHPSTSMSADNLWASRLSAGIR